MLQSVSRNVNILYELNASNALSSIDNAISIYQPGIINPENLISGANYSGFITGLRVIVNIKSIGEFIIPESNPADTEEEARLRQRDAALSSPRMCLCLYLKNSVSANLIPIGEILLFNRFPYYYIPLIPYFSDNNTFDVAPDTTIAVQMKSVGYGVLKDDDVLTIVGSAIEEAIVNTPSVNTNTPPQPDPDPDPQPEPEPEPEPDPDPQPDLEEDNEMANWKLISIDNFVLDDNGSYTYAAVAGDKLAINSGNEGLIINMPPNPQFGNEVKLLKYATESGSNDVFINGNGNSIEGSNGNAYFSPSVNNQEVSLIFIDSQRGWITSRKDILTIFVLG